MRIWPTHLFDIKYIVVDSVVCVFPSLEMDDGSATRPGQSEGDFQQAIDRFTEAITLNRNDHVLFSNRSYAYAKMGCFTEALEDARRCQELKPDWPKVKCFLQGGRRRRSIP